MGQIKMKEKVLEGLEIALIIAFSGTIALPGIKPMIVASAIAAIVILLDKKKDVLLKL